MNSMKKIAFNVSAREIADKKILENNWVCISVNEEAFPYYPIGFDSEWNNDRILRVRFSDVVASTKKAGFGDLIFNPIDGDTALKIFNFAERHKDKNFLVHCAAGVSRSSAICIFLHLAYGHELKENFWQTSRPNKIVLGALLVTKIYSDSLCGQKVQNFSVENI